MPASLLIVANDSALVESLSSAINKREFELANASSGRQALAYLRARRDHTPDIIVIDTASLRSDSKRLARAFRGETYALIILLSAAPRSDSSGTDQVLLRSLSPKKLAGRIKTAFDNRPPRAMQMGGLQLDLERKRVTRGARIFDLTPKEFGMLKLFMESAGQVVSRKTLMKQIWDTDYLGDTRTLDVHIRWLREKIEENASKPKKLLTARGEGYKLVAKEK
jgi:DNA-binding response OmpR family regulator